MKTHEKSMARGFTLVEMLVVISIIAVLSVLGAMGYKRFIDRGAKVQAMAQFRDFQIGLTLFESDYTRPPIPPDKKRLGLDTIYGDPNGSYSTQYLISTLSGENKDFPASNTDEVFQSGQANPRGENYMSFPFTSNNKNGVGKDGKLYDPWGHEVMVAINAFASEGGTLVASRKGSSDRLLYTYGLGEYTDTKPFEQTYVFWSYGKDGKKGNAAKSNVEIVPFKNSDDAISWQ